MKPGTRRRGTTTARLTRRNARRLGAVCSALGALVITSATLAPEAAAVDIRSKQWYLDTMRAQELWKISTGKGVKVAVIDSGVNPETPSLKGQVLVDEVPTSVAYHVTQDYDGHGTSMAELIAGTGAGGGIKGVAPDAKIIPFRVALGGLKDAKEKSKTADEAHAIRAAADTDAKIINMSFGGIYPDSEMKDAMKYAASKGKLMFASVGNGGSGKNESEYPASYPYANGVAALDKNGTVGKFSTHGDDVDLAAPGVDLPIWCDSTFTEYCDSGGTSQAAAIASASAALVWSVHPDWTGNQVLRSLIDTAGRSWPKSKPSNYLGYGIVRPRRVLIAKNINPGPANEDPLAYENYDGPSGSPTPPSSPSPSSGRPAKEAGSSGSSNSAAAKKSDSGDNTQTWVIIGAAAAVLVAGGAGFAVLRARRNA
ncbi:S8 family serine peptidase [Streptomyces sp. NBC_00820]|uniref:S8 family serine peptidase n=1 Tax=Streptomyces sp. NBC_00820 TaxID=2975842 RepID=UPI002ED638B5|nr:S8 family serine peptidase [Streptomyces sp. NBC_00820]